MFPVTEGLNLSEGGTDSGFQFIEEGGAERITKKGVVKVADAVPKTIVTVPPSEMRQ